jgi:prostaglandin-endoperoxide synthase 2
MFRIVSHRAAGFIFRYAWLWRAISRIPMLREWVNGIFISSIVETTPPRPYPFSLWSPGAKGADYDIGPEYRAPAQVTDYVSWAGLFDRSYTGRHLPPVELPARLPSIGSLAPLFARAKDNSGKEVMLKSSSSMLFCFFAQWFTDSFLRTDPNDARRNTSNHEIDLCQIYGLTSDAAQILRCRTGGELATRRTSRGEFLPFLYLQQQSAGPAPLDPKYAALPYAAGLDDLLRETAPSFALDPARRNLTYASGLERGNSTIFYTSISTMFAREHNRLARKFASAHRDWDDDRLFALARNTNMVMLLRIIIEEYINHLSGAKFKVLLERNYAERQPWYRTNRICLEFDLLYRWHSLVPDLLEVDGHKLDQAGFRYNNALVEKYGPELLIRAASKQAAGRIGLFNTPCFLLQADQRTISFGRMFKLAPFNAYRKHFGMAPYKSFRELAGDDRTTCMLSQLYASVDEVELVVGLLAEDRYTGAPLGDLMRTMVGVDAFSQALTNPLLSHNIYGVRAFSDIGIQEIENTARFENIVRRNAASGTPVEAKFSI